MSQILKNLQFITQSFTGTPNSGTGVIFASESKLYFKNDIEELYPLGGPGYIKILEYTGSNPGGGTLTYTWRKPAGLKHIQVICVGGGGGGGSGGATLPNATKIGGTGGGGGAVAWGFFDRKDLTQPNYTVSVGSGGAGGASVIGVNVSVLGNFGSPGEYTTFGGTLVSASGGSGGGRGLSNNTAVTGGAGGLATACLPGPIFALNGGSGIGGDNGIPSGPATNFFSSPLAASATAGGGCGGGWTSAGATTGYSGSAGAGGYEWNTLKVNLGTFGKPPTAGSNNLVTTAVLLQFTSSVFTTTYGLGGGGSGGDFVATSQPGTSGSNAGVYGAGGGGGSCSVGVTGNTAFRSGAGGSGSSGLCIIVEYY